MLPTDTKKRYTIRYYNLDQQGYSGLLTRSTWAESVSMAWCDLANSLLGTMTWEGEYLEILDMVVDHLTPKAEIIDDSSTLDMRTKVFVALYENAYGHVESMLMFAHNKGLAYKQACNHAHYACWLSLRVYAY